MTFLDKIAGSGLYWKSPSPFKKSLKLNYLSANVLRATYLMKLNPVHKLSLKKIYARGSKIPKIYASLDVDIHRGNKFKIRYMNLWMTGFKFGEFTWNRKIALYKKKQKKSKKKK